MPSTPPPFLPATPAEMAARGWDELDVLLVTGDAYVDHPGFGAALIGRLLEAKGYQVGIVAQPDWRGPEALRAMGRPRLFCGVTAGNLDSMLANYTAARHRRTEDAYSANRTVGKSARIEMPRRIGKVYSVHHTRLPSTPVGCESAIAMTYTVVKVK